MKLLIATIAALFAFAVGASAQQAVFGTGAFSQSETSQGFVGSSTSGAGSIGPGIAISSNVNTMAGSQASSGGAAGGTIGVLSGAASGTQTSGSVGVGNTSFSASAGQAGAVGFGTSNNQSFNGSAANAFGGFGVSLN